jgi:lipid-A-disaccharide synthase-like uncharacterized protein
MNGWFHSPAGWYALGFVGQVLFGSRFIVQWLASERQGRVVMPVLFWYLSLIGGIGLLAYAVHRKDPVFALGQAGGLVIYARNLALVRRTHQAPAA